jgi:hypothetical protein
MPRFLIKQFTNLKFVKQSGLQKIWGYGGHTDFITQADRNEAIAPYNFLSCLCILNIPKVLPDLTQVAL